MNEQRAGHLLARRGLKLSEVQLTRLGGGNNQVYRVTPKRGPSLVLKVYYYSQADPRDRLGREWSFSRFLWDQGLRNLPEPLEADVEGRMALYAARSGRRLRPEEIDDSRVEALLDFLEQINQWPERARHLAPATDACFLQSEHLALVRKRLERLGSLTNPEACRLRDALEDAFGRYQLRLRPGQLDCPEEQRALSPSDFGFHNALWSESDGLTWLDFEYAGWDDRDRALCDVFCQPAVPIPASYWQMAKGARSDLLLPLHQIKWCCILMNEFLPEHAQRRQFAGLELDETALAAQLDKAQKLLERVANSI